MKIVKILPMAMLFTLAACEQSADPATEAAATTAELEHSGAESKLSDGHAECREHSGC